MSYTFLCACLFIIFKERVVNEVQVNKKLEMLGKECTMMKILLIICYVK